MLGIGITDSAVEKWEKNQNRPTESHRLRIIEFLVRTRPCDDNSDGRVLTLGCWEFATWSLLTWEVSEWFSKPFNFRTRAMLTSHKRRTLHSHCESVWIHDADLERTSLRKPSIAKLDADPIVALLRPRSG